MNIPEFFKENYLYIIIILLILYLLSKTETIEHMNGGDVYTENENLKLLSKYLTLIIRKSEAEKELYTIQTGKRQVYNSPTLIQLNKQITIFKEKIRSNPSALKYFEENLNILI